MVVSKAKALDSIKAKGIRMMKMTRPVYKYKGMCRKITRPDEYISPRPKHKGICKRSA